MLGFGYRLHLLVDASGEAPIALTVTRANVVDGKEFPNLFQAGAAVPDWNRVRLIALDSAFDQGEVRRVLHLFEVELVIAPANLPRRVRHGDFQGPRAAADDQRTSVERFFALLKSVFGLHQWGITGLARVRKWLTLAVLACRVLEWANHCRGQPVHGLKAFTRGLE